MKRNELVVGLGRHAQVGKDTVGSYLVEAGWKRAAFADKLKSSALVVNPWLRTPDGVWSTLENLHADVGYDWDRLKVEVPTVRQFLQSYGTAARTVDDRIWLRPVEWFILDALDDGSGPVVVTDVRYPNEVDTIHDMGGLYVEVTRPGKGPWNRHPSENALDDTPADYVLENSGSLDDLRRTVYQFVHMIGGDRG